MLTQSAEVGYDYDIKRLPFVQAIPFHKNAVLQQTVAAVVKLAQDDLTNMVQTIGFVAPDGKAYPLTKAYKKACDFAFTQTATGSADYNTAIRNACKTLSDLGIRTIDYDSGVSTSLEAAVRRNILGGLGLLQEEISKRNFEEMGCDGWEISAHANSAPDHEPWQGKQFPAREYEALNGSLKRRIGTLNCGHAAFPILLGISQPQYTPEELERFRAENARGITYEGRHYTGYEAAQTQRRIERAIRRQKKRILVDEAAGDAEKLQTDQIRLRRLNEEYGRFSKAAGLRTEPERAQAAGFGRGQAARAAATVSDDTSWRNMRTVIGENAPKSLAEFKQIKYTGGERWRQLMENKRLFEKIDRTDTYLPEYKAKMKETYQYFLNEGFEFREHALNRVLGQRSGPGKFSFTREQLLSALRRPHNYRQSDGKLIRFYDSIAVVSAEDTGEVLSIIVRNTPRKDWEAL